MSLKPSIQPHPLPSLPSFASTFSTKSFNNLGSEDNSLPPIQTRSSVSDFRRVKSPNLNSRLQNGDDSTSSPVVGKKRARIDISAPSDNDERTDSDRSSPGVSNVKEEPEQDMLEPSPPPCSARIDPPKNYDNTSAPPPSSVLPSPLKKRRVTISGAPALDTNVRVPTDQSNSTPISPVVIGFTIQRDNPSAVEQVRSMISVKQQQQAIIEQRRGSVVGLGSPVVGGNPNELPASGSAKSSNSAARPRRSPNTSSNRRHTNVSVPQSQLAVNTRAASPPAVTVTLSQTSGHPPAPVISGLPQPSSGTAIPPVNVPAHSLPPPPISFARRRATQLGGNKKPADIVISPREAHTKEQLALSIQSAPPIPQAGQPPGRFPMTLPRLPSVMGPGNSNVNRLTGGKVPPTPTRFSAQRGSTSSVAHPIPSIAGGRSPPNHSIGVGPTLVPPTPSVLHHPGYSGEKSAFLAPFEMFYDALNDSRQLKTWLSEQLQRSNALMHSLTQQQEKLNEVVDAMVEKRVSGMRNEVGSLRHRVEELEDALRVASRRPSVDGLPVKSKGKQPLRNGIPMAAESYTFPPVQISGIDRDRLRPEPERRVPSPGWPSDRENLPSGLDRDRPTGSPAPYDSRRLSISASRLDPPRPSGIDGRSSLRMASPQQSIRDIPGNSGAVVSSLPPHPPPSGNRQSRGRRPSINRQHSGSFRGGLPERPASSPPRREDRSQKDPSGDVSMET
ncbi:hypothetical protein E1B28_012529 [Marasmius oreades]|uniref:Uncharacterized protein n=1 Tax=Marasmius oreades TaxID=181124 RepID=A0A9P7UNB8_9AGAR|nr:uncharacterized protein E1B28_012529 [Marasmius oreades]KAG7088547.1 hypothetical protein E1B28_012529 [Marasmius oreades]